MSETVHGGIYEGPKGMYHDANGEVIPPAEAKALLKQKAELEAAIAAKTAEETPAAVVPEAPKVPKEKAPAKKPS